MPNNNSSLISSQRSGCIVYKKGLDDKICFLVAYQKIHMQDGFHWVSPKGIIEPGENSQRAGLRETKEEVGIKTVNYISFLGTQKFNHQNKIIAIDWHLIESLNPQEVVLCKQEGFIKFVWSDFQQSKKLFTYKGFLIFLEKAYIKICSLQGL